MEPEIESTELEVLDFSNRYIYSEGWPYLVSLVELLRYFSDIVGEFRIRDAVARESQSGLEEWYDISGPEITTTLIGIWDRWERAYVSPSECRCLADKLYATEMNFEPCKGFNFMRLIDVFSLGSIMNGVVI